jgi:hypothetical protein
MSNSISSSSFSSAQSINSYESSQQSRNVYDGDKCSISQHGEEGVSLFDKQTGQSHEGNGDFGQGGLEGAQGKMIEQIVDKIIDKLGEALGIDLSSLKSGGQTPEAGGGQDSPISTCRREDFPPADHQYQTAEKVSDEPSSVTAQKSLRSSMDPFKMGTDENVEDHNALERAFDPIGMF